MKSMSRQCENEGGNKGGNKGENKGENEGMIEDGPQIKIKSLI